MTDVPEPLKGKRKDVYAGSDWDGGCSLEVDDDDKTGDWFQRDDVVRAVNWLKEQHFFYGTRRPCTNCNEKCGIRRVDGVCLDCVIDMAFVDVTGERK